MPSGQHEHADQVPARREPHAAPLVQHHGRPAHAAGAAAAPGHAAAGGARRPGAAVPDGADPAGGEHRARDRDPRARARGLQAVAAPAAGPRAPAGEGAGHAGEDLLQVRRRLARRQPQAQHRRAAGLVQRPGRHQEDRHRDRRRPVGLLAGLCRRAVRHRRDGVPGARELRPEALPPRADGNLRRHLPRQPQPADEQRPRHPGATPTTRARWALPSAKRWKWRPRTTTPSTRWARCSTMC
jgi:hypothetical protein